MAALLGMVVVQTLVRGSPDSRLPDVAGPMAVIGAWIAAWWLQRGWFEPRIFFYAERRFAGGQVYLHPNWHASDADQRLTIERLEAQRVPLVLERQDQGYEPRFPLLHAHVEQHYTDVPIAAQRMRGYRVRVDRRLTPTGTYEPLGLPCFRKG